MNEKLLKGICLLSVYSLPDNYNQRKEIYELLIKKKKHFHFVFEEKSLKKRNEISEIEDLFMFNNIFFTKKKTDLSIYERQFVKKSWTFV